MTSAPIPSDSVESAETPGVSPFMTAGEAGSLLRIGTYQVIKLCREKKLRATKPGKTWLILREDVEAYIAAGYNDAQATA